jgi:hypothetical protein
VAHCVVGIPDSDGARAGRRDSRQATLVTAAARAILVLFLFMLFPAFLQAQNKGEPDKDVPPGSRSAADALIKHDPVKAELALEAHYRWHSARDSIFYSKYNKYGDLRDDDPKYSPRRAWWRAAAMIVGQNVATTLTDRYVFDYGYARVGFSSWSHNIKTGWEWDTDRFGMNFFFHPYSGATYFNSARSRGYSFYQSFPFALGGSLMYEYFGENTLPSINDVMNTPISGAFLGEILYRLSSNILDDRKTGSARFFNELAAGAVDPSRALSRLMSGQMSRHVTKVIYQKEPLNVTLSTGFRRLNNGSTFGTGSTSETFNLNIDYGNSFEVRSRKPFDYFKIRTDLNYGVGRKVLDNVTGLGILTGKNVSAGSLEMLVGLFQHYDYWDNKAFELGTMAFGGGVVSKWPLGKNSNLYTNLHLNVVPLAGNSTRYGPDTLQVRDYNYGGGLGGKLETTLELGGRADAVIAGYYYWIHTYFGHKGDHYMAIFRPRVEVRVVSTFSLGVEHLVYYSDRYPADFHPLHAVRSEQRIFVKLLLEQFKRAE